MRPALLVFVYALALAWFLSAGPLAAHGVAVG